MLEATLGGNDGDVYIADDVNAVIRRHDPTTKPLTTLLATTADPQYASEPRVIGSPPNEREG